jgi:hypothetical protein
VDLRCTVATISPDADPPDDFSKVCRSTAGPTPTARAKSGSAHREPLQRVEEAIGEDERDFLSKQAK